MQTSTKLQKKCKVNENYMAELLKHIFFLIYLYYFLGVEGGGQDKAYLDLYLFLIFYALQEVGLSDIQLSFMIASVERMWIIKDTGIFELFIFRLLLA